MCTKDLPIGSKLLWLAEVFRSRCLVKGATELVTDSVSHLQGANTAIIAASIVMDLISTFNTGKIFSAMSWISPNTRKALSQYIYKLPLANVVCVISFHAYTRVFCVPSCSALRGRLEEVCEEGNTHGAAYSRSWSYEPLGLNEEIISN